MAKYVSVLALLFTMLFHQEKTKAADNAYDPAVYKELKNESYGSNLFQKMDVYLPANRSTTSTQVAILLHGGSWSRGDKADLNSFIKLLQSQYPELAIINANYRLASPAARFPAQIEDIQKLISYIDSKKGDWNISSNYALGGVSAGAHLAMLYAYQYDKATQIKIVLSVAGPTNFLDPYYLSNPLFQPVALNLMGKPISDSAIYQKASPSLVVTAGAPPTYMAYGGHDYLVPVTNATLLKQKLSELKVPHQYDFFPQEGHVFSPAIYDTVARKMVAFLKQYK